MSNKLKIKTIHMVKRQNRKKKLIIIIKEENHLPLQFDSQWKIYSIITYKLI